MTTNMPIRPTRVIVTIVGTQEQVLVPYGVVIVAYIRKIKFIGIKFG